MWRLAPLTIAFATSCTSDVLSRLPPPSRGRKEPRDSLYAVFSSSSSIERTLLRSFDSERASKRIDQRALSTTTKRVKSPRSQSQDLQRALVELPLRQTNGAVRRTRQEDEPVVVGAPSQCAQQPARRKVRVAREYRISRETHRVAAHTKYGKVDAKISYIARRAELALYSQAFSAWEYRNPHTLSRRLHSLVVKLHMNNLIAKEDEAFAVEDAQLCGASVASGNERARQRDGARYSGQQKRPGGVMMLSPSKHRRIDSTHNAQGSISLFFDGNNDLVRQVCTFLDAKDILRCSMTCTTANRILPGLVTSIRVSTTEFSVLTVRHRASFFTKFPNLERFTLTGDMAHAVQFDFQNETALISRNVICRALLASLRHVALSKLTHFGLDFAFTEGLHDRITSQVAAVLLAPSSSVRFPRLQKLSLRGNGISDDGVMHLFDALTSSPQGGDNSDSTGVSGAASALRELILEQNYIGERGFLQLEDAIELFAARGQAMAICMNGNLLAVPFSNVGGTAASL